MLTDFSAVASELTRITNHRRIGRVVAVGTASLEIAGLTHQARIGDQVAIAMGAGRSLGGEIVGISEDHARAMTYAPLDGAGVGNHLRPLSVPALEARPHRRDGLDGVPGHEDPHVGQRLDLEHPLQQFGPRVPPPHLATTTVRPLSMAGTR